VAYVFHWEQHGLITASIDEPAAGNNLTWTNPENTPIRILFFTCRLVTDAVVDDRMLQLVGYTGGNQTSRTVAAATQPPGKTRDYYFSPCVLGIDGGDDHQAIWAPLAHDFLLIPGDHIETVVGSLKIGDQLSLAYVRYRQELPHWLTG